MITCPSFHPNREPLATSTPPYPYPYHTDEGDNPRFSFNPVGINKLRETYKQLFSSDRPASQRKTGKTEVYDINNHHHTANSSSTPSQSNEGGSSVYASGGDVTGHVCLHRNWMRKRNWQDYLKLAGNFNTTF